MLLILLVVILITNVYAFTDDELLNNKNILIDKQSGTCAGLEICNFEKL